MVASNHKHDKRFHILPLATPMRNTSALIRLAARIAHKPKDSAAMVQTY
jgi:hypothetical protein